MAAKPSLPVPRLKNSSHLDVQLTTPTTISRSLEWDTTIPWMIFIRQLLDLPGWDIHSSLYSAFPYLPVQGLRIKCFRWIKSIPGFPRPQMHQDMKSVRLPQSLGFQSRKCMRTWNQSVFLILKIFMAIVIALPPFFFCLPFNFRRPLWGGDLYHIMHSSLASHACEQLFHQTHCDRLIQRGFNAAQPLISQLPGNPINLNNDSNFVSFILNYKKKKMSVNPGLTATVVLSILKSFLQVHPYFQDDSGSVYIARVSLTPKWAWFSYLVLFFPELWVLRALGRQR